jgi:phage I-like protein
MGHPVPRIITAAFASAVSKDAPGEIVYIPVGSSRISATVSGKPGEITVNVPAERGAEIAAALQEALDKRLSGTVRPRLAFDHAKTGPASGHPSAFSFDPERGILLAASWSTSGRAAIEGGDYGYFSPTFLINSDGIPSGLPDKGEIGSLVDEPAFRGIGLIAAADTDLNPETIMSQIILAALAATDETEAVEKISSLKEGMSDKEKRIAELEAELATLKGQVEAAEAIAKDAKTAGHKAKVEAAVAAGKIAPKDEETQAQALELLEASEALGSKFLAAMPVTLEGLEKSLVHAGLNPGGSADIRVEAAFTKSRAELGEKADFSLVWARAAELDPSAFN